MTIHYHWETAEVPEYNCVITAIAMLPHGVVEATTSSGSVWLLRISDKVWTLAHPPSPVVIE